MYGKGAGVSSIVTSGTITGGGVALLPNTAGNTLGTILAYSAITLGVLAITSQIIVRLARRYYQ